LSELSNGISNLFNADSGYRFSIEQSQIMTRVAITLQPATLRLDQAAAYCGLSVETFKSVCPVKPIEFTSSSRGHRWLRIKLDCWLASIDPNGATSPTAKRLEDYFNGGPGAT
jgi:hypothetical protein